ncbi:GNAT family N-acetyltransferase [Deinococcus humi]|uniref:Putative acetyltransferase n=1 Tax=Deinococcus humi TaxID=662880 RepID=A0A7W8JWT3_9DEIO|nr:GNAT family N-acetyltransferase [Deinococcus humi]MBB5363191.1 putative acetyltransferase [Deinococcus humi]GGO27746.1 GNAT family N-acetyltransferase [Deinococcus humi]
MPKLVIPTSRYKQSFLEAVREVQASGSGLGDTLKWDAAQMEADFDRALTELRRYEPGNELPDGFVNSEPLWLVEGEAYLGRASLRHTLNASLREFGGHIGYEIRPSARRQGHGRTILRLTLERARELGLERVLVTCDTDNLGSRGVIEGNGGVLEGEFVLDYHPKPLRRYWITL